MIDPKSQNSSLLSSALRFHMNKVDVFLLQGYFLFLMFNNGDLVVVLHFVIYVLQFPPSHPVPSQICHLIVRTHAHSLGAQTTFATGTRNG